MMVTSTVSGVIAALTAAGLTMPSASTPTAVNLRGAKGRSKALALLTQC